MFIPIIAWIYLIAMGCIVLYSLSQLQLIYYFIKHRYHSYKQTIHKEKTRFQPEHNEENEAYYPYITVQLPIYNEMYVVQRLLSAIFNLEYPKNKLQIQILDDSTDQTSQIIKDTLLQFSTIYENVDWEYIHRQDRIGFKAGALQNALASCKGELIAIFDADFSPESSFLLEIITEFKQDNRIAAVQTRWTHLNEHSSLLTELQAFMLNAHFTMEQYARNKANFFINFNGTAGIWRKAAIQAAGGWHIDTITEDLDLSYRVQLLGWRIHYDDTIGCAAELPPHITALRSQQFRWTKGAAEVARKHLIAVWKSPLSLNIKYQATAHLLNSSLFIAILITSILSIWVNYAVYSQQIGDIYLQIRDIMGLVFYVVLLFFSLSFYYQNSWNFKNTLYFILRFPLFLSATYGLSVHNSWAAVQGLLGIKSEFVRTPKLNEQNLKVANPYLNHSWSKLLIVETILAVYFIIGLVLDIRWQMYSLIPFHCLLIIGFSYMVILQFKSIINK